jgi:hypothetical protein
MNENGRIVQNCQTRESNDKTRFDRWSYDSEGQLVWHLALKSELLSYLYKVGHEPMVSSSGSLTICCRKAFCVEDSLRSPSESDWIFASPVKLGRLPLSYTAYRGAVQHASELVGLGRIGTHSQTQLQIMAGRYGSKDHCAARADEAQ